MKLNSGHLEIGRNAKNFGDLCSAEWLCTRMNRRGINKLELEAATADLGHRVPNATIGYILSGDGVKTKDVAIKHYLVLKRFFRRNPSYRRAKAS